MFLLHTKVINDKEKLENISPFKVGVLQLSIVCFAKKLVIGF